MISDPDPLDLRVRKSADAVPVPLSLEVRIRRSVVRKRSIQTAATAAAALLVASLTFIWISLRRNPPEEPTLGPFVSLLDPSPHPVKLRKSQLTTRVSKTRDGLVFRFKDGGYRDE